ncbi:MAG: PcfJ domain-containing protein [Lachnospiraceae bacterium]|nr:PcfJ domain-containing protein [Lachnospiraceae bacterium]
MEIKDYILGRNEMKELYSRKRNTGAKKVKKRIKYNIIFQDGCDFCVEKSEGIKKSELVILVSQGQAYIKEEGQIKKVACNSVKRFLSGLTEPLKLDRVCWLSSMENSQSYISAFVSSIERMIIYEFSRTLMKKGLDFLYSGLDNVEEDMGEGGFDFGNVHFSCSDFLYEYYGPVDPGGSDKNGIVTLLEKIIDMIACKRNVTRKDALSKVLYHHEGKRETMLLKSIRALNMISGLFGVDWAVKAAESYLSSCLEDVIDYRELADMMDAGLTDDSLSVKKFFGLDNFMNTGLNGSVFDNTVAECISYDGRNMAAQIEKIRKENRIRIKNSLIFKPGPFIEYLVMHPCSEGYEMSVFLQAWKEYVGHQKIIYGKVRDKYPKYLASSLMRMRYMLKIHKDEIDRKMWERSYEKMNGLEYEDGEYMIMAPEAKENLEDEARQQHNCLAGYIGKVTRGEEMILFMRKKKKPEKSLITIEVMPDGMVGQIFGEMNRDPSEREMAFIREWSERMELTLPVIPVSARAANDWNDLPENPFVNRGGFGNGNVFGTDGGFGNGNVFGTDGGFGNINW